jgi:glycosyltransferase involved in cell wall biosynthesis
VDPNIKSICPDISVIVPVFNVEKYLIRCLDSIFSQQFSGTFEVIAIDDGSTDNSLQLLKNYQAKESRLKIIEHGINKKLSVARGSGMNAASGKYIMHVDSDDWLLPQTFENLFRKCTETNADVVVFNYILENNIGKRTVKKCIKKEFVTADKNKVQKHFYGTTWNKLVKRSLTNDLISGQIGVNNTEDLLYSTEILLKAEKICLTPDCRYVYFVNNESLSRHTESELYLKHQITILSQLQKVTIKYDVDSKLTENILDYFEKWIYLELARIYFWQKKKLANSNEFIRELFQFPIMTRSRIRRLELSLKSGLACLLEVTRRFGLRMSLGIIRRSFKNKI